MDAGDLVPDEIVMGVIEECLVPGGPLDDGFVLDGFPRTVPRRVELDRVISAPVGSISSSTSTCRARSCSTASRAGACV